jgi:hypothetical protein
VTPAADALHITATNVSSFTINPQRAHVDCSAKLAVSSDGPLAVTLTGCETHYFDGSAPGKPGSAPRRSNRRCPKAAGSLRGSRLGPVSLGMTRARARSVFAHSENRGRRSMDFFCLTPRGIRLGYPSSMLLRSLSLRERRRVAGRVVLVLTANRQYSLGPIRPGDPLEASKRRLELRGPFHVGLNQWYLTRSGRSSGVLKVRHGVVQEVGVAERSLTMTRRSTWLFLTSFD